MPDNSQKLQLIQAIRQSGFPGSATDVFSAYDQGRDLIGEFVAQQQQQQEQQEQQQSQQQGNQGMAQGGPPQPPPINRPDGRVSQPNVNQPVDNNQGHLVQAGDTQNVGIQDLPTGPAQSQMIQARKGGVRQYKAGGVKKAKPYISKYSNGGGIFRTKKQKKIDEANKQILEGNFEENWDPDEFYEAGASEDMVFGKNTIIPEITVGGNEEGKRTAMFNNYMQRNTLVGDRASVPTPYYNNLKQTEKDFLLNSYKKGTFNPQNPYAGNNPTARNIMGKVQQGYGIGNNQTWMESFDQAGSAINPMRIAGEGAEYVYNNPKDAALFGADILAGAMTVAPEPITTGIGAAYLAYRGGKGLWDQHTKHQSNPEKYDPIGFNLQTAGNASYLIPGLGATGQVIKKSAPLIKNSLKHTANNVLKGGREVVTGAKTPFTKMPFRQTVGYTPSNKFSNVLDRVKNTSIGRTFSNNVEKTYKGVNQFFNPNKTPITSPIMKRFGTNQKMVTKFNSGPQTGYYGNLNRSTPGVSYPAGSINNTFGNVTNSIKGGINAAYYGTKVYGAKKGLEAVYNHSTTPSNWNNLDSNLNFGTDLANTVFGGEKVADLTKIGTYAGLGQNNKAITQAVGMLPFLKPFANVNKIHNKTKPKVNPNATSIVSK